VRTSVRDFAGLGPNPVQPRRGAAQRLPGRALCPRNGICRPRSCARIGWLVRGGGVAQSSTRQQHVCSHASRSNVHCASQNFKLPQALWPTFLTTRAAAASCCNLSGDDQPSPSRSSRARTGRRARLPAPFAQQFRLVSWSRKRRFYQPPLGGSGPLCLVRIGGSEPDDSGERQRRTSPLKSARRYE